MRKDEYIATPGHEALHTHFGLSYASYLTLPRSVLQSMPDEWQGKMADLLNELDEAALNHGIEWPPTDRKIVVLLRPIEEQTEPDFPDDLADYQRGGRLLW